MATFRGERSSSLVICGNSLARDFTGDLGDTPYQVMFLRGINFFLSIDGNFIVILHLGRGIMDLLEEVKVFLEGKSGTTVVVQVT